MVAGTGQFCHFRPQYQHQQTCIEVKIVRSDKQMSQDPAIACAVRQ